MKILREGGLDCTVSNIKLSSVTLNERQREHTVMSSFNKAVNLETDPSPNRVKIVKSCLEYMSLYLLYFLISQNTSNDLKGPKQKYKLHYGRCTGLLFRAVTSCSDNK